MRKNPQFAQFVSFIYLTLSACACLLLVDRLQGVNTVLEKAEVHTASASCCCVTQVHTTGGCVHQVTTSKIIHSVLLG